AAPLAVTAHTHSISGMHYAYICAPLHHGNHAPAVSVWVIVAAACQSVWGLFFAFASLGLAAQIVVLAWCIVGEAEGLL
ncbi:hypothetical protein, partial [Bacillus thuringiensis]|uniref:hypothetical protein n=1 Tax=Bacillus thuringiensis TaxID=1428 RepID=UPI001642781C